MLLLAEDPSSNNPDDGGGRSGDVDDDRSSSSCEPAAIADADAAVLPLLSKASRLSEVTNVRMSNQRPTHDGRVGRAGTERRRQEAASWVG
jgi:hypothetical protein